MIKTVSLFVAAVVALVGFASTCQASIVFTLSPGAGGIVALNIAASGIVNATNDSFLLVGDPTTDSFLPSGLPNRTGTAPVPGLSLGGCTASNSFYRDDNGAAANGVQSLLGFFFGGTGCSLNGAIDLSSLNGTYNLPGSVYSDFVVGTYTTLISGVSDITLQGLGAITLVVGRPVTTTVPEPGTLALFAIAAIGAGFSRKRRTVAP